MTKRSSRNKKPSLATLKMRAEARSKIGKAPEVEAMAPCRPHAAKCYIELIGGKDPVFVTEKEITTSDLNKHHDRIMFPAAKLKNVFLTEEEDEELEERKKEVILVEPSLKNMIELKLGKWYMGGNLMYVFNGGWRHIVEREENRLRVGRKVQLWSFRVQGYLVFVLLNV